MKYKILHKNKEFAVIVKPAGLLVHGADHIKDRSMVDDLLKDFPQIKKIGDDPVRPGIVHRLDKLASGLMVVALTQESFYNLKKQFQKRTIDKFYTALVFGKVSKDEDEITFPIIRSSKGHKMASLPNTVKGEKTTTGRNAKTNFWIKNRFINYTLIKVKIKTGRTHQIRVHMTAYGHPLVGDDLYSTKKTRIKNRKLELGRIFLVADKLEFTDLQGKRQKFETELPDELKEFMKIVK